MNYFSLGSKLDYPDLNALVYLLRKFKKLTSTLKLGSNSISSDYGTYTVTGGLTSVGGNFILEDTVTISSSDVLLNCFYTFHFTVVDVNLSGTVNRRVVSVTGDTGDDGVLEVVLEPSLLESDEVILPDFKVDIVFDEHEYYTPVSTLDITLTVDKEHINVGEVATVTATVLDNTGTAVSGLDLQFKINGDIEKVTTDSDGVASVNHTGIGAGWINVTVGGKNIKFYDGDVTIAEFSGNYIVLGDTNDNIFSISSGEVIIDWGDGTQSIVNNPPTQLTHRYVDGSINHDITFIGNITGFGRSCFGYVAGLTSIVISNSVVTLGDNCFLGCTALISVSIPSTVSSIGYLCFKGCTSLLKYQLYWVDEDIIQYNRDAMPNNAGTIFIVPEGQIGIYTNDYYKYPANKVIERGVTLTLSSDRDLIKSDELATLTAILLKDGEPLTHKTVNYVIKHGDTIIEEDSCSTGYGGRARIVYAGTGVGEVDIIVSYNTLESTYQLIDATYIDDGVNYLNRLTSSVWPTGVFIYAQEDNYGMMYFSETKEYSSTFYLPPNSVFEFDIEDYGGGFTIRCDSTSENQQLFNQSDITTMWPCHVKIVNNGTSIDYYIDDVKFTKAGVTSDNRRLTMRINANSSLLYSNLCYYTQIAPKPVPDTILVTGTSIIEMGDTDMLTACLLDGSVPVEGETLSYEIKHGATVIDSGSDTTDSNGEISISYTGTGVGDVDVIVSYGSSLQETYELEDFIFYSLDGTDLTGTYETGSDGTYNYITNLKADVQLSNLNLPSHFIFSMKYYPNDNGGWGNSLWLIGSDANNGLLIGAEGTNTRLRIYNWNNGSASSQQVLNNSFSTYSWNELEIEYNNGVWTTRVGTNSVTWSKTFNPTLIKNYSDIPKSKLCEFKIKAL